MRGHRTVTGALREWLRDHGEDSDTINSAQATRWLSCAEHARQCARVSEVPLNKTGPSSKQPAIAERYRVGRADHKAFHRMQGLRGDDGLMIQDPALVDQMLWDSRKEPWGSAPPMPELANKILDAYFRDRSVTLPAVPCPSSRDIAGQILAAGGSATGHNGIPYEAYHQGVELATEALALAVFAAHHDPPVLDVMLDPNVDLLLWTPKKAGADRPDGQRRLQLPTCFRMLFGSFITLMVAPQVEPRFSEWQASVKGGTCAMNVISAFEHLAGLDEPIHRSPGLLWRDVLDDAADSAEDAHARTGRPDLRASPAVVLADQSKAFERMGMAWLRRVMDGWKFPQWVKEAFDALLGTRGVRACIGSVLGYLRMLARGLGMGNTPVVHSSGAPDTTPSSPRCSRRPESSHPHTSTTSLPSYGDRSRLWQSRPRPSSWQPDTRRACRSTHTCSSFHTDSGIDEAKRILTALPVKIYAVGYQGGFRATGMPGVLTRRILEPQFTEQWARLSWIEHFPCRCIVKTQVIPSSRIEEWAAALSKSPFGPSSVSDHRPHLGACLHCRTHGPLMGTGIGDWLRLAAGGARHATWTRATCTIVKRVDESEQAIGSHAQEAITWNIYVTSVAHPHRLPSRPQSTERLQPRRSKDYGRRRQGHPVGIPPCYRHPRRGQRLSPVPRHGDLHRRHPRRDWGGPGAPRASRPTSTSA